MIPAKSTLFWAFDKCFSANCNCSPTLSGLLLGISNPGHPLLSLLIVRGGARYFHSTRSGVDSFPASARSQHDTPFAVCSPSQFLAPQIHVVASSAAVFSDLPVN
jgi:hypothetical protein